MGPNPIGLVSSSEDIRTDTQRDDHVRAQGEGRHLHVRQRGLWRTQPWPHLDPGGACGAGPASDAVFKLRPERGLFLSAGEGGNPVSPRVRPSGLQTVEGASLFPSSGTCSTSQHPWERTH